ncbi:beta-ketoacyl synthase N-terminal-like domain-containing protein [Chitinophagaceae bacterium MMS25-I14]
MDLYINSTGWVSAAGICNDMDFLPQPIADDSGKLLAQEPDYTGMIAPMQLRRMSKAVRMGIAASRMALQRAGIEKPDAISVGTAMGCLQDTEVFLSKMVAQDEQMLTPTAFIQSTHNTVSGQIALLLGCYGHNLTYVQRGHSFEHALINARLYLQQHPDHTVLVGGIDELTDSSFALMQRAGAYRKNDETEGCAAGEGAAFFVVSTKPLHPQALLLKRLALFTSKDPAAFERCKEQLLGFGLADIDLVMSGTADNERSALLYPRLQQEIFTGKPFAAFKNETGEYATAGALALAFLTEMAGRKEYPAHLVSGSVAENAHRFVIINHYLHHYACWLLEKMSSNA